MAVLVIDALSIASALIASWLWFRASGTRLRRISRTEEIDAADLNRIVVGINRAQILNAQAAMATAVSAFVIAVRFLWDLMVGFQLV
jgi:hypothetical protein